jgi:hypothetical protein
MEITSRDHLEFAAPGLLPHKLPPIPVPEEYYDAEYAAWLAENDPAGYIEYRAIVVEAVVECFL